MTHAPRTATLAVDASERVRHASWILGMALAIEVAGLFVMVLAALLLW